MNDLLTRFTTTLSGRPLLRCGLLAAYYGAVLLGLFAVYGRGLFNPPPFVYQGF
jgi:hypothetical protein